MSLLNGRLYRVRWFKHDTDAHADSKLKKLIIRHGIKGYGLYWYCLEEIARAVDIDKYTFELEHDAEIIAHDVGLHIDEVQEMMTFMVDLGLFENKDCTITCLKMAKRLDKSMTSNPHMRKIIEQLKSHDGVMTESELVMQDKTKIRLDKNKTLHVETPKRSGVPVAKVVDLYHKKLPHHPQTIKVTPTRAGYIKQRWAEDLPSLDAWGEYFDFVAESRFLTGKEAPSIGRTKPFIADLEWLTKPANIAKVIEGKYHV